MEIKYNVTYAFHEGADPLVNAIYLRALLDAMVEINIGVMRNTPKLFPPLYKSGVVYKRTYVWEPIPELYLPNKQPIPRDEPFFEPVGVSGGAKGGDCKSLTAALVAQYMLSGVRCQPVFRWIPRGDGSGALDFHILVQTASGFEDPSKVLGMNEADVARFYNERGVST